MERTKQANLIESIWQELFVGLPVYPWFNTVTKQIYPRNVFREMQRCGVTWDEGVEMLDKVHALRNELMQMNLGNHEFYLIRENKRFKFSVYHNTHKGIRLDAGLFSLWDDFDRHIGEFTIRSMSQPPTDDFIEWIEEQTKQFCEGYIPCSKCGKIISTAEIAGRYFAGVYCRDCWEGGVKQMEARETYD